MSCLAIAIQKEEGILEPRFVFTGCGVIMATVPATYDDNDIKSCVSKYIDDNNDEITNNLKKATKEYRKKWTKQVDDICSEYGLGDLSLFTTKIKIARFNQFIDVVYDVHGIMCVLRVNIDPISSLLSEDVADTVLRYHLLHEALQLYKISRGGIVLNKMEGNETTTTHVNVGVSYYNERFVELECKCKEFKEKMESKEVFEESRRVGRMPCIYCSI